MTVITQLCGFDVGKWYKTNEKDFNKMLNKVVPVLRKYFPNLEPWENSVLKIGEAFDKREYLYIQFNHSPMRLNYRSNFNDIYMDQWIAISDILSKPNKELPNSFISNGPTANYKLNFNTWYEVNKTEYDEIIRGLPVNIHKSLWDDQIDYCYKAFNDRCQIYIAFDYIRSLDDETYILNVSKTAPLKYDKPKLILTHTESRLTELKVIDDKAWFEQVNKIISKKEEKVMEENKIHAIRSIIENYVNDCEKEYRAQYEAEVKLIKADDENVKAAKIYLEVLNKNRDKEVILTDYKLEDIYCPTTDITCAKIKAATNEFDNKITNLHKVCSEAENLCNLCDTYEEMRKVLADYDIILDTKKRGK